jgi:hypothetical protein
MARRRHDEQAMVGDVLLLDQLSWGRHIVRRRVSLEMPMNLKLWRIVAGVCGEE